MTTIPQMVAYGTESQSLRIGTLELPCFILNDKREVFSINGLQKALGYDGKSEDWLFDLLSSINKFYPVPGQLFEAYENPVLFEIRRVDGTNFIGKGIPPEVLISTCQTIQNAKNDGYLNLSQLKHAKAAAIIAHYFSEHDIQQAIAQATGLNFIKESGKAYLQEYLLKNIDDAMYQWVEALRDAFWEKMLGIQGMDWTDLRDQPKNAADMVQEVVFSRLTDHLSNIMRTNKPKRTYRRKGYKVQDIEHAELGIYISEVLSLLKAANDNWTIFIQLLNRIYPKNNSADLKLPEIKEITETSGVLDQNLKKAVALNKVYHKNK
jgi:hypothetical protein